MRTWSIETCFVRAYVSAAVAAQGIWDAFGRLEAITRPTRRPSHDVDEPLAEGPDLFPQRGVLNTGHNPSCLQHAPHYVTPRGRNHQCYCGRRQDHPLDDFGHRPHICPCGQLWADLPTKSSASNHTGTCAEPAPSPTIVQSAPPPTVDGEGSPADSGIPPSPAGERPTSELLRGAAECLVAVMQSAPRDRTTWHFTTLIAELRDRAATFKAIEE